MKSIGFVVAIAACMALFPSAALAASPVVEQYALDLPAGGSAEQGSAADLPLTGLDLKVMAALALALVGLGVGANRRLGSHGA